MHGGLPHPCRLARLRRVTRVFQKECKALRCVQVRGVGARSQVHSPTDQLVGGGGVGAADRRVTSDFCRVSLVISREATRL